MTRDELHDWRRSMKSKLIHEHEGEKTFALIFDTGDEAMAGLRRVRQGEQARRQPFHGHRRLPRRDARLLRLGEEGVQEDPVDEQVEVLSLIGDVALKDGEPKVHAHVVVGRSDGSTRGGHLIEAHVRPTLEVILTESPAHLRKQIDEESRARADPDLTWSWQMIDRRRGRREPRQKRVRRR